MVPVLYLFWILDFGFWILDFGLKKAGGKIFEPE
jgi:hypothetical protein